MVFPVRRDAACLAGDLYCNRRFFGTRRVGRGSCEVAAGVALAM